MAGIFQFKQNLNRWKTVPSQLRELTIGRHTARCLKPIKEKTIFLQWSPKNVSAYESVFSLVKDSFLTSK